VPICIVSYVIREMGVGLALMNSAIYVRIESSVLLSVHATSPTRPHVDRLTTRIVSLLLVYDD
jgi:hypothetical protein